MSSKVRSEKYLWIPRIFTILVIVFYGLFALGVWSQDVSINQRILDFFIHLLPSLGLTLCLWIAWRKEILGAVLFLISGLISILVFHSYESMEAFLLLSFPIFVIAALFLISDNLNTRNQYYK